MEIGCPNWHQGIKCSSGDIRISGCIPEALTTTLEGLSKEEKRGCRSWQMNGMRKAHQMNKRKVGIFILPDSSL